MKRHEVWTVGDGNSMNVWHDKWIDSTTCLREHVLELPPEVEHWRVSHLVTENGGWCMDTIRSFLPEPLALRFCALPPPSLASGVDIRVWPENRLGEFSVASAYQLLQGVFGREGDVVWQLNVPERIRCFTWQIMHGRLATNKTCHSWRFGYPYCPNCPTE